MYIRVGVVCACQGVYVRRMCLPKSVYVLEPGVSYMNVCVCVPLPGLPSSLSQGTSLALLPSYSSIVPNLSHLLERGGHVCH